MEAESTDAQIPMITPAFANVLGIIFSIIMAAVYISGALVWLAPDATSIIPSEMFTISIGVLLLASGLFGTPIPDIREYLLSVNV